MGKGCKVGQNYSKTVVIESNCPINFEYEIKEVKGHPDMKVNPVSGDIIGNGRTEINFNYNPSTFTTAEAMFEIRTSEFDFKPQTIRITGSAQPQKIDAQQFYQGDSLYQADDSMTMKNKTLLTDKSNRGGITLDKIPERNFKTKKVESNDDSKAIEKQSKTMKLSEVDMAFLKEYRTLEDLEREKGIKFFECIGDPPATAEFKEGVKVKRQNFISQTEANMREKDIGRFQAACNEDKVVVPTKIEITEVPKWDVYENNHFAMRKRLVSIFLKVANKLIIR